MKNVFRIFHLLMMFALLFLAACSSNSEGEKSSETEAANASEGTETYTMKVATPTSNDPQTFAMDLFKEKLEAKTDGQIKVELYPSSQLGSNDQMLQQLTTGTIHGLLEPTAFLGGFAEILTVVDIPYLWPDVRAATEYLNNEGKDLFEESLNEKGLTALQYYEYGPRIILLKNEISSLSDFEGQKIRVMGAPVLVDEINAWGGSGVAMGVPELYTALEQGTIDGIESAAMFFYAMKYHEGADYVLNEPRGAEVTIFMGNDKWLKGLPEDLRSAVYETAEEIKSEVHDYARKSNDEAMTKMEEAGLTIIEPSSEFHDELVEASQPVYDQFINRVEGSEEIINKIKEYFPE